MKIGLLTSGGDCQSLNAMMASICKSIDQIDKDCIIIGFVNGFEGLKNGDYNEYKCQDFFDFLYKGGTILGTSRTSFKTIVRSKETVESMVSNYKKLGLECLIVLGGNGSHKVSNLLSEKGLNVISFPKTIDNDLYETDMTFGFPSAFDIASRITECIQTTAGSHQRIFMIELMGRKAGWLALYTGIACQVDMILIPEIPYDKKIVFERIKNRDRNRPFVIICAEGAISLEDSKLSYKEYKDKWRYSRFKSAMTELRSQIKYELNENTYMNIPAHIQRGGSPIAYDRLLVSRLGSYAGQMIQNHQYGYLVAIKDGLIDLVPLKDVAGKIKTVNPDCAMIQEAKKLGICFGNE